MKQNQLVELRRQQVEISKQVIVENHLPPLEQIRFIAGADVSHSRFSSLGFAGVVVMTYPGLETVEERGVQGVLEFPYIPGFLSFREFPLIRQCLDQLQVQPDVLICDGQGIAHPRRAGLATHTGVLTNRITIGCGKSRLCGEYQEPDRRKGSVSDLMYKGDKIGEVVRSRDNTHPLFISPGHKTDFATATRIILSLCAKYRQPEPIRRVHNYVNQLRLQHKMI